MNAEKKLGLAFVGILSVTFCGVLTMRLLDANKAEQIDINVGPPVASAPDFVPPKTDAAAMATAKPTVVGEQSPPASPRFVNATNTGLEKPAGYLPPVPKSGAGLGAGLGADPRYGSPTSGMPSQGGMPTQNTTATSNAGYSGGSRYGTPSSGSTSPTGGSMPTQSPPATAGMSSPASASSGYGSRYGTPSASLPPSTPMTASTSPAASTPATPPAFGSATPTASATLSGPASAATPYGTPATSPQALPSAMASSTASTAGGSDNNPLRASRPTAYGESNSPSSTTTASSPPSPPSFGGATAPSNDRGYGAHSMTTASTNTLPSNPLPSPAAPSIPSMAGPSTANVLREPRAFDSSAAPSQPLSVASAAPAASPYTSPSAAISGSGITRSPGVAALGAPPQGGSGFGNSFSNSGTLRASGAAGSSNDGTIAPTAATMPVGASASVNVATQATTQASVKNTPYLVAPDDNFWSISKKVYGDGSYYRALFAYNSDRYPHAEDVRSGSVIDVPPAEVLKQRYPDMFNGAVAADGRPTDSTLSGGRPVTAAAAGSYTVREGDTLYDIARRQLGKASRWNELYELNRQTLGDNLENLRPGTQLVLPQ